MSEEHCQSPMAVADWPLLSLLIRQAYCQPMESQVQRQAGGARHAVPGTGDMSLASGGGSPRSGRMIDWHDKRVDKWTTTLLADYNGQPIDNPSVACVAELIATSAVTSVNLSYTRTEGQNHNRTQCITSIIKA